MTLADIDLTPAHRRILAALASFDPCTPSMAELGRRARTSRRETQKLLAELVAHGEVTVVQRPKQQGKPFTAPLYVLSSDF